MMSFFAPNNLLNNSPPKLLFVFLKDVFFVGCITLEKRCVDYTLYFLRYCVQPLLPLLRTSSSAIRFLKSRAMRGLWMPSPTQHPTLVLFSTTPRATFATQLSATSNNFVANTKDNSTL